MNKKVLYLVHGAVIAALYVVLTMLANALGLANYAIQVRFSEALTILPVFTPAAIPGLFLGCIISNTMTGCMLLDIIFGSLATLIGAFGTYLLRDKNKWLAPLPPIIANTIIVPFVLYYVNQDIPVLAILEDGEAVLVTGFNEFNVVIMEPATGKLYKKGMNDATAWFAENGNHFITYMRTEN